MHLGIACKICHKARTGFKHKQLSATRDNTKIYIYIYYNILYIHKFAGNIGFEIDGIRSKKKGTGMST